MSSSLLYCDHVLGLIEVEDKNPTRVLEVKAVEVRVEEIEVRVGEIQELKIIEVKIKAEEVMFKVEEVMVKVEEVLVRETKVSHQILMGTPVHQHPETYSR